MVPSHGLCNLPSAIPYLVLIGLHELQPYAPARVMRQAMRKQVIPRVINMDAHRVDYEDNKMPMSLPRFGAKRHLDKKSIEADRYHAGTLNGCMQT